MRETTAQLVFWIIERDNMRERKDAGGKPDLAFGWSSYVHMGTVRYCNVRREDDSVTRWLARHWRPQFSQPWHTVLARMVNYIPTLNELVVGLESGSSVPDLGQAMKRQRALGHKIWTSAYTISTAGQTIDKVDYVMGVVADVQGRWTAPREQSLAAWHHTLSNFKGLGSFLSAQVVADMKNTVGHPLASAPDWYAWSAYGPGSMKGLAAYFGTPCTPKNYPAMLSTCWEETMPHLPDHLKIMHMQDFQNCMCEFSKYMRVREGGHVRNKYHA